MWEAEGEPLPCPGDIEVIVDWSGAPLAVIEIAAVRLSSGRVRRAEVHWYEAHGVGRVNMNVKRFID